MTMKLKPGCETIKRGAAASLAMLLRDARRKRKYAIMRD